MRHPAFEAFIAPARARPQIWRLILGSVTLVGVYTLFIFPIFLLVGIVLGAMGPEQVFGAESLLAQLDAPDTPVLMAVLLASFLGMVLGAAVAAAWHWRGLSSLLGTWRAMGRSFCRTLMLLFPVYGVLFGLGWVLYDPLPNIAFATWLKFLPLMLPLLLVQITAEELVFRGYLLQQLAARFSARWVWMGLPSIAFGLMHYDPMAGHANWGIIGVTFVFALVATDLTERTGNLGAAMALHFVNNFLALFLLSVAETMTGMALYVTSFGLEDTAALLWALAFDVVVLIIVWRILRRFLS